MPLIICLTFFAIVFLFEYMLHLASVAQKENEMVRYQRNEHPRRLTSDRYLDWLG